MDNGEVENTTPHLESAARLSPGPDYVHYLHCQLQAPCRKDGRTADADREFDFYEKIKTASRGRASGGLQTDSSTYFHEPILRTDL
jgi:hypothetical protein